MIGPKDQGLHKSNVKVTATQHEAAMKKGAREIKPGAVIYKQGRETLNAGGQCEREGIAKLLVEFRRRLLGLSYSDIGI